MFASDALAAGVSVFTLARLMGTSVEMIERHYGTLIDGTVADVANRLDALDVERDHAREVERRLAGVQDLGARCPGVPERRAAAVRLNKLGADGWELAEVVGNGEAYVFKRARED